jgi:uncharacterized membrane protein
MLSEKDASMEPGARASLLLSYPVAADEPAGAQHFVEVTGTSSVNSTVWSTAGAVVVVNQLHRMQASLVPDRLEIPPGEQKSSSLSVDNQGNGPEAVSVRLENVTAGWSCGIEDSVLAVDAGAGRRDRLSIGIPGWAPAGITELAVNVSYGKGGSQLLSLTVEVPRIFAINCSIIPAGRSVGAGKQASFELRIDNLGNSPEKIMLAGSGARAGWIHPAEDNLLVNLSAGREMELRVRPGPEAMPGKYILWMVATGEGNDTCNVSFNLTIQEAATGTSDIPCLLGAVIFLAVSAAAYLVRRKLARDARRSCDDVPDRTPPGGKGTQLIKQHAPAGKGPPSQGT